MKVGWFTRLVETTIYLTVDLFLKAQKKLKTFKMQGLIKSKRNQTMITEVNVIN